MLVHLRGTLEMFGPQKIKGHGVVDFNYLDFSDMG